MAVCILGIDPGITGGVAFWFPDNPGHIIAEDIPNAGGYVDTDTLAARIRQMSPTIAIIEGVHADPKWGKLQNFRFGEAYGALKAIVSVLAIPHHLVAPTVWKKHFRLSGRDKERSRALAIQYWPGAGCFARKMDHGRAEAALLARYGEQFTPRQSQQEEAA